MKEGTTGGPVLIGVHIGTDANSPFSQMICHVLWDGGEVAQTSAGAAGVDNWPTFAMTALVSGAPGTHKITVQCRGSNTTDIACSYGGTLTAAEL